MTQSPPFWGDKASPAGDHVRSTSAELEFRDVTKVFVAPDGGRFLAIGNVSLDIAPSEFVCIIGGSGSGKSTLLNMAAGIIQPTSGGVFQGGRPISGFNTNIGYMTQDNNLLPWRTLGRNVALPLELRGWSRSQRRHAVQAALAQVGLDNFADHYVSQLSGGMRKRATLARTLVYDPPTLLMDEPFGALDAQLKLTLQRELLSLWERERKTVVFVTHDLEEAILLGDRVVVLGSPEEGIVHVEEVVLPRPRDLVKLRTTSEFSEIWERLWRVLESRLAGEVQ